MVIRVTVWIENMNVGNRYFQGLPVKGQKIFFKDVRYTITEVGWSISDHPDGGSGAYIIARTSSVFDD
jgi:hypothetical protein